MKETSKTIARKWRLSLAALLALALLLSLVPVPVLAGQDEDYDQVYEDLEVKEWAVDSANSDLESAAEDYAEAKANYDEIAANLDRQSRKLDDARAAAAKAQADYEGAVQEKGLAETRNTDAKNALREADTALTEAKRASANASAAKDRAESSYALLEADTATDPETLADALSALNEATQALETATLNLTTCESNVSTCQAEVTAAADALKAAAKAVKDAEDALDEAQEAMDVQEIIVEDVLSYANEAREVLDAAEKARDAAQDALNQAESALNAFKDLGKNKNMKLVLSKKSFTYTGKAIEPARLYLDVVYTGDNGSQSFLYNGLDYKVSYKDNINVGTATIQVKGQGDWSGTKKATFKITKANSSITLSNQSKTYTGKALKYTRKPTVKGSSGAITYTYYSNKACTKAVQAKNVKAAKTYYVKATLEADDNYTGATSKAVKFTIKKAVNPVEAAAANKTIAYSKVKAKKMSVTPLTISNAQGDVKCTVSTWTTSKAKKYFEVKEDGTVTAKKGTPKNTYKFNIKVDASGNSNYLAGSVVVPVQIKVK